MRQIQLSSTVSDGEIVTCEGRLPQFSPEASLNNELEALPTLPSLICRFTSMLMSRID
jgi:hypothetical protein